MPGQNLSLLLNFIEAQTKRDWRYFMNEKELSTNSALPLLPTYLNYTDPQVRYRSDK